MTPALSTGLAAIATVAGAVWFRDGFRALRIQRLIRDTPTARARSMAMGLVELTGTCESRSQVAAPFSGRACAYWQVEISIPAGRNRVDGRVLHRASSGNPFYLRDETGLVLVQPQGARCRLPFGLEETVSTPFTMPAVYRDYMRRQGLGLRLLWPFGMFRFRERVLESGQGLYVLGRAHPRAQSVTVADGDVEHELQQTGTDAWRARRVHAADETVRGVIRRDGPGDLLILSPSSEKSVEFEYALRGWAGVVLGPLLTIGAVAVGLLSLHGG